MALFARNTTPANLGDALAVKAATLRDKNDDQTSLAAEYRTAAVQAEREAAVAKAHAEAVEAALDILERAGVVL